MFNCQIYLITPPAIADKAAFLRDLTAVYEAVPVAALQIRLKNTPLPELLPLSEAIRDLSFSKCVAVLMNDDVALAQKLGLDGVHLGQSDMKLKDARKILGSKAMIGITCHNSRHLAMEAAENGADYVAFGAFFPTETKAVEHFAEPEILSIWQETMETPCVAIGGINAENAKTLADAGADFIAVSNAVWGHPLGPVAGAKGLWGALTNHL